jgi:hypothetical protein
MLRRIFWTYRYIWIAFTLSILYHGLFQMMVAINGEERTLGTWIELTTSTGWKIIEIFPIHGVIQQQILAVPA